MIGENNGNKELPHKSIRIRIYNKYTLPLTGVVDADRIDDEATMKILTK